MKLFLKLVLIIIAILLTDKLFAQHKHVPISTIPIKPKKKGKKDTVVAKDTAFVKKEEENQKDVTDIFAKLFHKKVSKEVEFITSKPSFTIVPALGYTLVSKLALVIAGNVAFRTAPQSR